MTASERQQAIMKVLCQRRKDTRENLAFEFGVTPRTINNDIISLSLQYPIYTKPGPHGGIYVAEGFYLERTYLSSTEFIFLSVIADKLLGEEKIKMKKILRKLKRPEVSGNT